jgi:hypothetical protein
MDASLSAVENTEDSQDLLAHEVGNNHAFVISVVKSFSYYSLKI